MTATQNQTTSRQSNRRSTQTSGESNREWGEFAEHDSELASLWDSFDRLPERGGNAALDAFCDAKRIDIAALIRLGAKLSDGTVLAFGYGGTGVKFRDVVTDKRWNYAESEFPHLKLVRRSSESERSVAIVAESETDGARLSMEYPGCDIAIMGAGARYVPATFAEQLNGYEQVLVATDNDEAGNDGAAKIAELVAHAQRFAPPEGVKDWCEADEFPPLPDPPAHGGSVLLRQSQTETLIDFIHNPRPVTFLPASRLGEQVFPEGSTGITAGHKKDGKSWAMTIQSAGLIAAGRHVVFVDNENGFEVFAERLSALGVDEAAVLQFFHYVSFPQLPTLDQLRAEFEAIQRVYPGAAVVLDSLRSLIAQYGLEVKDPSSIEKVLGAMMAAVKNPVPGTVPLTVIVLDHASMGTTAQSTYVAAWNAAKAQAVDWVYYWEKEEDFSEALRGRVTLHVKDDRRGKLVRKRSYSIGGQGEGEPLHFEAIDAGDSLSADERRAAEVAHFVRAADEAQRHKDVVAAFPDVAASTVDRALKLALTRSWIAQDGERKPYYAGASVPPIAEPAI